MSYEVKKAIFKLEDEIARFNQKNDITPNDLMILKDIAKSYYYLTTACAMEEAGSNEYGRMMPYYNDEIYGARSRDSRGRYKDGNRYMEGGNSRYGHYDISEEKMYLEKMLQEARSESEREVYRRKLEELNMR